MKKIKKQKTEEEVYDAMQHEDVSPVVSESEDSEISVDILNRTVELVSEVFHLKDKGYFLVNFDDKVETVKVVLSNRDFEVTVKIKDTFDAGLRTE